MIIGIEGLSRHGKTTFIDMYLKKYPDAIRFRGAGAVNVGMKDVWQQYNFSMRNIIEHLDMLNDYKKVILWDRFLTDAVYTEDKFYASEILRVMKSHKQKAVIFIKPEKHIHIERSSKEGDDFETHKDRYLKVIKSFDTHIIHLQEDEDYFITDRIIDEAHAFIQERLNRI